MHRDPPGPRLLFLNPQESARNAGSAYELHAEIVAQIRQKGQSTHSRVALFALIYLFLRDFLNFKRIVISEKCFYIPVHVLIVG